MRDILKIYKSLSTYKGKIKLYVFLSLINAIFEIIGVALVVPILTLILSEGSIINFELNSVFLNKSFVFDKNKLLFLAIIFIISFFLVKTLFLSFFNYWRSHFIFSMNETISSKLFRNYLYQPYSFHVSRNTSISSRNLISVQNYVRNIDQFGNLITEIIILTTFFIFLIIYEPYITLIISFVTSIFLILYIKIISPIN